MISSTNENNIILIVDDHHVIRRTLKQWLANKYPGVALLEASNGETALEICRERPPDLVLMDVHLPVMNGIETAKQLKSSHPQIKVVMLTVQEDLRYQISAQEAGADGYVIKRQMYTDLIPAIATFLDISAVA
jgi:DNA-binding NarL/FixJ family response regulator